MANVQNISQKNIGWKRKQVKMDIPNAEDGGQHFTTKKRNVEYTIDNRWVVPYCPLLSKIFNAHINVEFCNSVKSIKYIC